jgi:hypothetical protein
MNGRGGLANAAFVARDRDYHISVYTQIRMPECLDRRKFKYLSIRIFGRLEIHISM